MLLAALSLSGVASADPSPEAPPPAEAPPPPFAASFPAVEASEQLVVEPPRLPIRGVPWVVRYSRGTPMNTGELLNALDDPGLDLEFRRLQRRTAGAATAQLVLGAAAFGVGYFGAPFFLVSDDPAAPWVLAGLLGGGAIVAGTAVIPFANMSRRSRYPATWLEPEAIDAQVDAHNAATP